MLIDDDKYVDALSVWFTRIIVVLMICMNGMRKMKVMDIEFYGKEVTHYWSMIINLLLSLGANIIMIYSN